ncbi:MAG: RidA family protein [Euryarchaeota archaeon]|nr:RidA family protein [Euryarchaeota archaeon]
MMIENKLKEFGHTLPMTTRPVASYIPTVRTGNLLHVAGTIPTIEAKPQWTGKVGKDLTLEEAQKAAVLCVLNSLAYVKDATGDLDNVARIVRVNCFVATAPGFIDAHKVANGASDFLVKVWGENGKHARTTIGVAELPMGVPVEVEILYELK